MTAHQRHFSTPIDPVKLDRLAEVAVKVGLRLQAGQDLLADRADDGAAVGAQDRRTCLQGRRRHCDADLLRRSGHAVALQVRRGTTVSTAPRTGFMTGWRKPSPPTPRGSPSSATIRCCSRARTPPRSRAPARPIPSPTSRRWSGSSISTSIGTSSPIRARHGRSRCSPRMTRMSRSENSPTPSSRPRASTTTTPSHRGRSTTPRCANGPNG